MPLHYKKPVKHNRETDYTCLGCEKQSRIKFKKPGPIGRVVYMFKCPHCESQTMLFMKRIPKQTEKIDIAPMKFKPGPTADKMTKSFTANKAMLAID